MSPCLHEEADTRILLHAMDAARKSFSRILLRTVDTDVVVLAVSSCVYLDDTEIWVAFGVGNHLRYIPTHDITNSLGQQKSQALPLFHAFTGCDTVSFFAGRGKKTAFDTWKSFEDTTPVFAALTTNPASPSEECMKVIEAFVVLMYDRTCTERDVNIVRKNICK